jgi:selenide,water dikinase
VWRVSDDRALVATTDFITPIVDDARTWGRVAAVNSVSDVYAMGGRPLFALNLVCWNAAELPARMLDELLAGAAEVANQCGYVTVGGHTVDDPEPKFGLSVVGEAHPDRLLRNSGLRNGDALVLTKAVGTGIIATAAKAGAAATAPIDAMVASMCRPNADAATAALDAAASGATDITGFGLLGHLTQAARASGVDVTLDVDAIPVLPAARDLAAAGYVPGGSRRNLDWVRDHLHTGATEDTTLILLADAQTSGGLLFGAAPPAAADAAARLRTLGHDATVIGHATEGDGQINLQ